MGYTTHLIEGVHYLHPLNATAPSCVLFPYYRRRATYMTNFHFLRGKQESIIDIDVCHLDDDSEFSMVTTILSPNHRK